MKKVGLITFHRPINFGAALQSVALVKAIESCGAECEIIDYVNPAFEKAYKVFSFSNCVSLKRTAWEFLMLNIRIRQKISFSGFIKENAKLTSKCNKKELQNFSDTYDLYITGSDQVFNYNCSGSDASYYLDFVKNKPKYSYAASFGDSDVPAEYVDEYKKHLTDFSDISVRESSGIGIVQKLLGRQTVKTLDPTLLLNQNQWGQIVSKTPRQFAEPYILIYLMAQSDEINAQIFSVAQRLQEKYHYSIVVIGGSLHKKKNNIHYVNAKSPYEFVALFRDASYVVTNSFHGTAFSVNFRKNFYSYVKPNLEIVGRVESLLTPIGLRDRIFSYAKDVKEISDVSYSEKEDAIAKEIEESYAYLRKVLNNG